MPAAGKTVLGAALADRLALPCRDLDALIAAEVGRPIADLLRHEGEQALRIREATVLETALAAGPGIVATGGGAPVHHDGMAKMRAAATVLWLDAAPTVLVERTLRDDTERPLLGHTRSEQQAALASLDAARRPVYGQAHLRVDASQAADAVLRDALRALQPAETLTVGGALGHPVIVHDGHACDAAERIADLLHRQGGTRLALVVETKLLAEATPLLAMLQARGIQAAAIEVPGGEKGKDLRTAQRIWEGLAAQGIGRRDLLVVLGGGATTDLGGFCAATWLRGIGHVLIPTTVLAMADAAIGGKVGVNLAVGKGPSEAGGKGPGEAGGKNLVGAFHAPKLAFLPLATLDTLTSRDWRAGLAEIAKIFHVFDGEAWTALLTDGKLLRRRSAVHLRRHLLRALQLKAEVVAADPFETAGFSEAAPAHRPGDTAAPRPRALLNFGHTFGHAAETGSGYTLRHGEAVALGMVAAAEVSEAEGWAPAGTAQALRAGLTALDLPTAWEPLATPELLACLGRDKKAHGDSVQFVATSGPGRARLESMRLEHLAERLRVLARVAPPAVRWRAT